jgi:hypothetical protein
MFRSGSTVTGLASVYLRYTSRTARLFRGVTEISEKESSGGLMDLGPCSGRNSDHAGVKRAHSRSRQRAEVQSLTLQYLYR